MSRPIVVTGATGHVGRELTLRLLAAGQPVRAVARGPEKLAELAERGAEVRAGSLQDRSFLKGAFEGAEAAFAMVPPNYTAPDVRAYQRSVGDALAGAVREARVARVVSLSSVGAEAAEGNGPIGGLHDMEQALDAVPGLDVAHLRPGYFYENHMASIALIKGQGINGSAIKAGVALATVATRDIAALAARLLAERHFSGRSVRYLIGPRDYTMAEATRILGSAIGKPDLRYVEFGYDDVRKALIGAGFSAGLAGLFVEMQDGLNQGRIKAEPRTPENSGPTTLEEFARSVFVPAFAG